MLVVFFLFFIFFDIKKSARQANTALADRACSIQVKNKNKMFVFHFK